MKDKEIREMLLRSGTIKESRFVNRRHVSDTPAKPENIKRQEPQKEKK